MATEHVVVPCGSAAVVIRRSAPQGFPRVFGEEPEKDGERRDLLEILEDRYDRSSTVLTSQLPTDKWHAALGDPTVADAVCDRVVHNAHVLILQGPSGRQRKGLDTTT